MVNEGRFPASAAASAPKTGAGKAAQMVGKERASSHICRRSSAGKLVNVVRCMLVFEIEGIKW